MNIAGNFIRAIDKKFVRDNGRLLFHRIAVMLALLVFSISVVGTVGSLPDVMFRYDANHSGYYSLGAGEFEQVFIN